MVHHTSWWVDTHGSCYYKHLVVNAVDSPVVVVVVVASSYIDHDSEIHQKYSSMDILEYNYKLLLLVDAADS